MDLEGSGLKSRYSVIKLHVSGHISNSIALGSSCSKQDRKSGSGYVSGSGSYTPLSLVEGEVKKEHVLI